MRNVRIEALEMDQENEALYHNNALRYRLGRRDEGNLVAKIYAVLYLLTDTNLNV